jgi:hypothetical protein
MYGKFFKISDVTDSMTHTLFHDSLNSGKIDFLDICMINTWNSPEEGNDAETGWLGYELVKHQTP